MFEVLLISVLDIYTSNPYKNSCVFQGFFITSWFTYINIRLLPENPYDLTYQLSTTLILKRFPGRFTSVSHSLSLKRDITYQFPRAVENALIGLPAPVAVSKLKKQNVTLKKNI